MLYRCGCFGATVGQKMCQFAKDNQVLFNTHVPSYDPTVEKNVLGCLDSLSIEFQPQRMNCPNCRTLEGSVKIQQEK